VKRDKVEKEKGREEREERCRGDTKKREERE